jgi:hypothetical protein
VRKKYWIITLIIILFWLLLSLINFSSNENSWILGLDIKKEDGKFTRSEYGFKHQFNVDYRLWQNDNTDYDFVFFYECEPYYGHMAQTDQCDIALDFFPASGGFLIAYQYNEENNLLTWSLP